MMPETLFNVEASVRIQDDPTRIAGCDTDSMSAVELLAVTLAGEGKPNSGAYLGAAADRLAGPRGLLSLRNATALELVVETGIPHLRAETIVAAIELGARLDRLERGFKTCISSPHDVDSYLRSRIAHLETENFVALLLDTKNKILASPTISVGTISSTLVHPREVFKPAIRAAASSIIVAHNHPSGTTQPSHEDIAVTKRLAEAGETLGIGLLAREGSLRQIELLRGQHVSYFAQNKRSWRDLVALKETGVITLEPALEAAVADVLTDAERKATPLFPVRPQMRLGWLTDLDRIQCVKTDFEAGFTEGSSYNLATRSKLISNFETRVIERKDGTHEPRTFEKGRKLLSIRIRDPRDKDVDKELDESTDSINYLTNHFDIPDPGCVATLYPDLVADRRKLLKDIARRNNFTYRLFQLDHYSRLIVKERGLLAHEQGLGKTLGLMSLAEATIRLGAKNHALFVVPQDLLLQWSKATKQFFGRRLEVITHPAQAHGVARRIASGEEGWWISHFEALSIVGRKSEILPTVPLRHTDALVERLEDHRAAKKAAKAVSNGASTSYRRTPPSPRPLPSYSKIPKGLFSLTGTSSKQSRKKSTPKAAPGTSETNSSGTDSSDTALRINSQVACPRCGASTDAGWNGQVCQAADYCATHGGALGARRPCPEDGVGCVIKGCGYVHRRIHMKSSYTHLTTAFEEGVICVDEISEIRGDDSLRSKSIRALARGPHKYGATGTPLSNFISDSYWALSFSLGASSAAFPYAPVGGKRKFEDDYCVTEFLKGREEDGEDHLNKRRKVLPEITNVSQFWRLAQPGVSRCRMEQTGEKLVKRTYLPIQVPMGIHQSRSHAFWLNNFVDYFLFKYPNHPMADRQLIERWAAALGQLWHLERAATLPASEQAISTWPRAASALADVSNYTPATLKVLELAMKHAAAGEKVLIGSDLVALGPWIADRLSEKGVRAVHITEETGTGENRKVSTKNPRKRAEHVHEFLEGDAQVLCSGVKALRLGHDLGVVQTVIVHGLPYSFEAISQFIARVRRLTSEKPITVYTILPKGSLAETKWKLLGDKGAVSDLAFDGEIQAQPDKPVDWNKVLREMRAQGIKATGDEIHEEDVEARWRDVPPAFPPVEALGIRTPTLLSTRTTSTEARAEAKAEANRDYTEVSLF